MPDFKNMSDEELAAYVASKKQSPGGFGTHQPDPMHFQHMELPPEHPFGRTVGEGLKAGALSAANQMTSGGVDQLSALVAGAVLPGEFSGVAGRESRDIPVRNEELYKNAPAAAMIGGGFGAAVPYAAGAGAVKGALGEIPGIAGAGLKAYGAGLMGGASELGKKGLIPGAEGSQDAYSQGFKGAGLGELIGQGAGALGRKIFGLSGAPAKAISGRMLESTVNAADRQAVPAAFGLEGPPMNLPTNVDVADKMRGLVAQKYGGPTQEAERNALMKIIDNFEQQHSPGIPAHQVDPIYGRPVIVTPRGHLPAEPPMSAEQRSAQGVNMADWMLSDQRYNTPDFVPGGMPKTPGVGAQPGAVVPGGEGLGEDVPWRDTGGKWHTPGTGEDVGPKTVRMRPPTPGQSPQGTRPPGYEGLGDTYVPPKRAGGDTVLSPGSPPGGYRMLPGHGPIPDVLPVEPPKPPAGAQPLFNNPKPPEEPRMTGMIYPGQEVPAAATRLLPSEISEFKTELQQAAYAKPGVQGKFRFQKSPEAKGLEDLSGLAKNEETSAVTGALPDQATKFKRLQGIYGTAAGAENFLKTNRGHDFGLKDIAAIAGGAGGGHELGSMLGMPGIGAAVGGPLGWLGQRYGLSGAAYGLGTTLGPAMMGAGAAAPVAGQAYPELVRYLQNNEDERKRAANIQKGSK